MDDLTTESKISITAICSENDDDLATESKSDISTICSENYDLVIDCKSGITMLCSENDDDSVTDSKSGITMICSENDCNCSIEKILKASFDSFTFEQKLRIVENGPPKPALSLETKTKAFTRHFNKRIYDSIPWLCGCKQLNKLYCWPCLLFATQRSVWTTHGFDDLRNIYRADKYHRASVNHIVCQKKFQLFGKDKQIEFILSQQCKIEVEKHNETVKYNRQIMSNLIMAVCFLGSQGLAFRSHSEHDENNLSLNRGNYVEILNLLARYDNRLRIHLETSTVFSGFSPNIQNDLIFSVSEMMIKEIRTEISEAHFVALILNETSDIPMKCQMSAVLRYVSKCGKIEERFLRFVEVSSDRSVSSLYQHIVTILDELSCGSKLVAQSYDGTAIKVGEHTNLQAQIIRHYNEAIFVHCFAHELNSVLCQSTSFIKQVGVFFISLQAFGNFFSKLTKKSESSYSHLKKWYSFIASTKWQCQSQLVKTVHAHKFHIRCILGSIVEMSDEWDLDTISSARGLLSLLKDFEFNFMLEVFSSIFPFSDDLHKVIQTRTIDVWVTKQEIEKFQIRLRKLKGNFDQFWSKAEDSQYAVPPKRPRISNSVVGEERKSSYRCLFYDIIAVVCMNINVRISSLEKLQFFNLLESQYFQQYKETFPKSSFASLKETYGWMFDLSCLKNELAVIYSDPDMHKESVCNLYQYIRTSELTNVFTETYKLCALMMTIPVSSVADEQSFSVLKRIENYVQNCQGQDRLSSLALLNIEKSLLQKLQSKTTFEDDVIDIFATKNQNIDLVYKK